MSAFTPDSLRVQDPFKRPERQHGEDDVEDPKKGDGKKTAGRKGRQGDDSGESSQTPKVPALSARAFYPSDADEEVELVLRADGDYEGSIWIEGLGDDGAAENLPLSSAEIVGVGPAEVEQSKIKNMILAAEETVRVRLRLKQSGKYAVRATLA